MLEFIFVIKSSKKSPKWPWFSTTSNLEFLNWLEFIFGKEERSDLFFWAKIIWRQILESLNQNFQARKNEDET